MHNFELVSKTLLCNESDKLYQEVNPAFPFLVSQISKFAAYLVDMDNLQDIKFISAFLSRIVAPPPFLFP